MNEKTAKKLRKYGRQQFKKMMVKVWREPFKQRLWLAWHILVGK